MNYNTINIICIFELGVDIDLIKLNASCRNTYYDPVKSRVVVMNFILPKGNFLIHKNSKILGSGKNEIELYENARKVGKIIKKLGYDAKFLNFKIVNNVFMTNLNFPINLEKVYIDTQPKSFYETELFPAVFIKLPDYKITIMVFVSGKILFVGKSNIEYVKKNLEKELIQLFEKCRKKL